MHWFAVSEAWAEVKQKQQHHPVGIHCFAQGCLYRFAKHHKRDANAFAVHTSQLKGNHFGMRMSYLMLRLAECCGLPSVSMHLCTPWKKMILGKGKNQMAYWCNALKGSACLDFSSFYVIAPRGLILSLVRSTMVKMAQRLCLAPTRACRCKVSSSPAPPTIFGWNFPPTRRWQQPASSSHTTVSHIWLLGGGGGAGFKRKF